MAGVREYLYVVVVYITQVQLVKQHQSVLEMDVIISDTMHDQEASVLAQSLDVTN